MRAYELMIILDSDLDDAALQAQVVRVQQQVEAAGGRVANIDRWGRRRFAYHIDHKAEGYYVVFELVAGAGALDGLERQLRLADEVVRHKLIHLPDDEAARRKLFPAEAAPTEAG